MFNWLQELLEIRYTYKERKKLVEEHHCAGCEILKMDVERLRQDNSRLLDRILEKPELEPRESNEPIAELPRKNIPWQVRRQMLEAEDREKAKKLKNAPVPIQTLENEILDRKEN